MGRPMTMPQEVAVDRARAQLRALVAELEDAGIDCLVTLHIGTPGPPVRLIESSAKHAVYETRSAA